MLHIHGVVKLKRAPLAASQSFGIPDPPVNQLSTSTGGVGNDGGGGRRTGRAGEGAREAEREGEGFEYFYNWKPTVFYKFPRE